jgi:[protein-PII] uridylyltransferase
MFDNRSGSDHTVVEITTQDRPGLLFTLANLLQKADLTISLAKINTQGEQVADVFYVCDSEGAKLMDPKRVEELKQQILRGIDELQQAGDS